MKTPREILLARHRAAGARLDAVREAVLAQLRSEAAQAPVRTVGLADFFLHLAIAPWRELILPARRVWTSLAAVWAVLILVNVLQGDHIAGGKGHSARPPSIMVNWPVEQHWMNEFLADRAMPGDADRPRNAVPRPRTEDSRVAMG